jgi:hypothetical protein
VRYNPCESHESIRFDDLDFPFALPWRQRPQRRTAKGDFTSAPEALNLVAPIGDGNEGATSYRPRELNWLNVRVPRW